MNTPNNTVALYTVEAVAQRLSVTPSAVYKWKDEGRIKSVRLGRAVRIPVEEVERIIKAGVSL